MPRATLVDFKAVKSAFTMEQLLDHYGLRDRFKRSGDSLSGPCPIHKGSNPTQFRISAAKNIWNCFGDCKRGGNTLDFVAQMENVSIHAAALKAIDWFRLDADAVLAASPPTRERPERAPKPQPDASESKAPQPEAGNKPLKFRLDKLQMDHPYLAERSLTPETIVDFGVGFCAKGMLAGRVAIPIRNPQGEVVAYAGRHPGDPPGETPKYKLPQGFHKSLELFNIDRALREPSEAPWVVVEGFFGCMALHQHGCRKVVALMGSSLSAAQEELLRRHTDRRSRVILLLDEDEAGRAGRKEIAARLSLFLYVAIHSLGEENRQPDDMGRGEMEWLLD
jgi:DNA primase